MFKTLNRSNELKWFYLSKVEIFIVFYLQFENFCTYKTVYFHVAIIYTLCQQVANSFPSRLEPVVCNWRLQSVDSPCSSPLILQLCKCVHMTEEERKKGRELRGLREFVCAYLPVYVPQIHVCWRCEFVLIPCVRVCVKDHWTVTSLAYDTMAAITTFQRAPIGSIKMS